MLRLPRLYLPRASVLRPGPVLIRPAPILQARARRSPAVYRSSPESLPVPCPSSTLRIHRLAYSHPFSTMAAPKKHKIAVIGSGNWGCTIAKIVAENTAEHPDLFDREVQMWVFEEDVAVPARLDAAAAENNQKQKLTHVINTHHENVKYLPNIRLPANLVANPSVVAAAHDATLLIFNLPHQFIGNVCKQLAGHILPYARGISCIKGVNVADDGISLFSEWIGDALGIYCGSLSGANLATEIALEKWSETTIAYDPPPVDHSQKPAKQSSESTPTPTEAHAQDIRHRDAKGQASKTRLAPLPADYPPLDHNTLAALFHRPYFHVSTVTDVAGVSLSGALKNVVALAAGFVDGRGWGDNAKAAVMRVGLMEMVQFGREFFAETVHASTFTAESAGVADLITSCMGGRNFRCAKLAIQRGVPVGEVERTELNGQKLQGTTTAHEIHSFLKARGAEARYPLFTAVEGILVGRHQVDDIPRLVARAAHNIEHGAEPVPINAKL